MQFPDVFRRHHELQVRLARLADLALGRRPHHDDSRSRELAAQLQRLRNRRDAERRRACSEPVNGVEARALGTAGRGIAAVCSLPEIIQSGVISR